MNTVDTIIELLRSIGTVVMSYWAGKTATKLDRANDDKEVLEKYRDIDHSDVSNAEVYNENSWGNR